MTTSSPLENSSLPSIVKVKPMLMFTGFLGSGKTTLLRELLDILADKKIQSDVILNDRENAYIDKATLQDRAADIRALTGACVCCEGFHDLMNIIMKVSETQYDVLLLELNGTADPIPLQESFTLLESKFCLRPRWQVCVVDPRHFRKRRKFNDLEILQLETASHYYISHSSELNEEDLLRIKHQVKEINPRATRTNPTQLAAAISQAIHNNTSHTLAPLHTDSPPQSPVKFGLKSLKTTKQNAHHDRHKLAHEFTGCQIIIPEASNPESVVSWLDKLPISVIRAKALLTLEGDPKRLHLFERVGLFTSPNPISAQTKTDRPCSGIFIGPDLDPEEILKLSKENLHPGCHFPEPHTKK